MAALIPHGYCLYARAIVSTPLWTDKPAEWFKIVMHIYTSAEWRKEAEHKPGQALLSYNASLCGVSRQQWSRCLTWLQTCDRSALYAIDCQKRGRAQLITLINWSQFQSTDNYLDSERHNKGRTPKSGPSKEDKEALRKEYVNQTVAEIMRTDDDEMDRLRATTRDKYHDLGLNEMGYSVWGTALAITKYRKRIIKKKREDHAKK